MPVGVQCPISSSLGEFPLAIGIGSGVLGFRPYWCPSPFPSPSILCVFHSLLSAIIFQSCFFFTADVSPPIRSTLHLLTFYVSSRLGMALVPDILFFHSFIHSAISIAPLQVIYYSEALPTTARILYRSFTPKRTGNCR